MSKADASTLCFSFSASRRLYSSFFNSFELAIPVGLLAIAVSPRALAYRHKYSQREVGESTNTCMQGVRYHQQPDGASRSQ